MPSHFGWVDFAETDRQRMLDVVRLFKETETRDELGLGTIRDAFADYFFPGTSTIQTRIRYMLFVPWIYRTLEEQRVSPSQIVQRARERETQLIQALLRGGETAGVIGRRSKARLKRLPSNIYWAGLKTWGVLRFDGSQDQYHRSLGWFYQQQRHSLRNTEREAAFEDTIANWDPGLPDVPLNLLTKTTFTLTQPEAHYLRDRIRLLHGQSLLAHLFNEQHFVSAAFIWEHPLARMVPDQLQQTITYAHNFSETLYGAALLYNLLLARKRDIPELVEDYQTRFKNWTETISARELELRSWHQHLAIFWACPALQLANIPHLTRTFVEAWLQLVFTELRYDVLTDSHEAQQLIQHREIQLKRSRARLDNPRALELWNGSSGDQRLDFRWQIAQTMANDIITCLHPQEDIHA